VCGYEPNPITLRKIEALHASGEWDIHLAYWRTPYHTPFTMPGNPGRVHPIDTHAERQHRRGLRERIRGLAGNVRLGEFCVRLGRVVREVNPDLIHASNSNMLVASWPYCIGRPGRALVYDLLDTDDAMRRWPVVPIQRMLHRRVDQITVPSPRFVSHFLRSFNLIPSETEPTLIMNAPWSTTFAGLDRRGSEPFVVGYIGSLRCQPAIEWLIDATMRVRERGANVELLFAGTGVARARVEQAAAAHSFVTYSGPYDYQADIRSLYERIDAVYAVYEDSWDKRTHLACRLSDAVAANRAVIVSAGTLMGEIVQRDRLGYVVDAGAPESLDAALEDAARQRDQWRSPSRIPESVRIEHRFEHYVPRLRTLYHEALQKRRHEPLHA
jgi:succinoglycan biosynthesis protein ExoL